MGKFDGILLCTDFDGTFAEHAQVSRENAEAVRYFQREGGLFTIASGRSPEFLWTMRDIFVPNAPVISVNGTLISDERDMRVLREFPLDNYALSALCELAECTQTEVLILYNEQGDGHHWKRESGMSVFEALGDVKRPWYKALLVQKPELTQEVLRKAIESHGSRYAFECSWPMGIEMHLQGTGKGECVTVVKEMLGGAVRTTVGVGDFDNDISLLRLCDIGYAVENATDAVKRAADRITVRNTEHAIARVIADLDASVG